MFIHFPPFSEFPIQILIVSSVHIQMVENDARFCGASNGGYGLHRLFTSISTRKVRDIQIKSKLQFPNKAENEMQTLK